MSDVGFDRTDQQRAGTVAVGCQSSRGGLQFDGIAKFRAGAVSFQIRDFVRRQFGSTQCFANDLFLSFRIRHGQPAAGSVVPDRRSFDDGQNRIAIALGISQSSQRDNATTFAT